MEPDRHKPDLATAERAAISWLLESDPSIRWQVMRDLTDASAAEVAAERSKVVAEAVDLVKSKRDEEGKWPLDTQYAGKMLIETDEGEGKPSRWNTLRALRVLRWYSTRQ